MTRAERVALAAAVARLLALVDAGDLEATDAQQTWCRLARWSHGLDQSGRSTYFAARFTVAGYQVPPRDVGTSSALRASAIARSDSPASRPSRMRESVPSECCTCCPSSLPAP